MRRTLYVSPHNGQWKIHWEGENSGDIFSTKEEAVKRARAKVRSLPEGTCAQIIVQRENGTFQTEWTYGNDPYPPIG